MISEQFKKAFFLIFFHFGISIATFFLIISFLYGEFPPPVEKISSQLKSLRSMMKSGSATDVSKIANDRAKRLDATLEVANDAPSGANPPATATTTKKLEVVGGYSGDTVLSELRQLRLKIQDLEAHQQEQLRMIRQLRVRK